MEVTIQYKDSRLRLRLPDETDFEEFRPVSQARTLEFEEFIAALDDSEAAHFPLSETELFVVNDAYRPTPTALILEWLRRSGRLSDKATFLVATGCHQAPDDLQLQRIFGDNFRHIRRRVLVHDAENGEGLKKAGTDPDGNEVFLNRSFIEAEKVTIIGSVEPHYFAGFTGGRKAVFPGLCDRRTTARNHGLAIDFAAGPMKLEGNPVHENLQQLMALISVKKIFSIQIVMDCNSRPCSVQCGDIETSFMSACRESTGIFGRSTEGRFDLLLAEVRPPLDSNLYQLQKSLENCQRSVSDGGTIILFSSCREGIGTDSFYRLAEKWNTGEVEALSGGDNFGIHKLTRVKEITGRINVFLYSELPGNISRRVFYQATKEPQTIIDKLARNNKFMRIALVRDSGHVVLMERSEEEEIRNYLEEQ